MRPARMALVILLAFAAALLAAFWPVLARDEQFGFRDAAHYYYPLHKRTADQWGAGHLPLWDPGENGGMTLIGNPTAAVLYPGKVVFAIFPYPLASRLYLVGHVAVAFAAMLVMLRGFGLSASGSALGALAYAFGGPVLFQYSNAIYLVGAAWLPLGFLAAEGWLRRGDRRSLAGLGFVLALQCLGGDVQAAYLLGGFVAASEIVGLFAARGWVPSRAGVLGGVAAWCAVVLGLAAWLPSTEMTVPDLARPWLLRLLKLAFIAAPAWWLVRRERATARKFVGLIAAAIVGAAVAAVQLLPVAELAAQSYRMAEDNRMDIYGFSVEPYRAAEMLWPGVFGIEFPENRLWLYAVPPIESHVLWSASLYLGGLTIVLAAVGLAASKPPPWRRLLAVLAVGGLALSFGRFGGPLWWGRYNSKLAELLGPHGSSGSYFFRSDDGFVHDAFGTPYWLMAALAPGFDGFRFPAKFGTFGALGIAGLAALGWDRLALGGDRLARRLAVLLTASSLVGLLFTAVFARVLLAWWEQMRMVPSLAGPIDSAGALWELRRAFVHGAIVGAASWGVIAARNRRWTGAAAVLLLAIDLVVTNSRIVWSVPQSEFARTPRAVQAIAAQEQASPEPGPFRIARLPEWYPVTWIRTRSPDRLREVVAWERDTLQSRHGTLYGLAYTLTPGVLEPESFVDVFQPWVVKLDPPTAGMLGLEPGAGVRYFPRRAFDLWGSRYFLLPAVPVDWLHPNRAVAGFLPNTDLLVPPDPATKDGAAWREGEDWLLLRNRAAYPRAWVVHDVRFREPMEPGTDESRALKRSLLHQADPFWTISEREVEDPRRRAWVETNDPKSVGPTGDGGPPQESETARVVSDEGGAGRDRRRARPPRLPRPGRHLRARLDRRDRRRAGPRSGGRTGRCAAWRSGRDAIRSSSDTNRGRSGSVWPARRSGSRG